MEHNGMNVILSRILSILLWSVKRTWETAFWNTCSRLTWNQICESIAATGAGKDCKKQTECCIKVEDKNEKKKTRT